MHIDMCYQPFTSNVDPMYLDLHKNISTLDIRLLYHLCCASVVPAQVKKQIESMKDPVRNNYYSKYLVFF